MLLGQPSAHALGRHAGLVWVGPAPVALCCLGIWPLNLLAVVPLGPQRHGAAGHAGRRAHAAGGGRPLWAAHQHRDLGRLHVVRAAGGRALAGRARVGGRAAQPYETLRRHVLAAAGCPGPPVFVHGTARCAVPAMPRPAVPQVPAVRPRQDPQPAGGDPGLPGAVHLDASQVGFSQLARAQAAMGPRRWLRGRGRTAEGRMCRGRCAHAPPPLARTQRAASRL